MKDRTKLFYLVSLFLVAALSLIGLCRACRTG